MTQSKVQYNFPVLKFAAMLLLLCQLNISQAQEDTFLINGLDDQSIQDNVSLYLRQLDEYQDDINTELYAEEIKVKVRTSLEAFSFYNSLIAVQMSDETVVDESGNRKPIWEIEITLNDPTIVDRVVLVHDLANANKETIPNDILALIEELADFENAVLDHVKYENLKNRLRALALFYGFFDFSFPLHKLAILPTSENTASTALIHWIFNFGQRYKFGDVEYLQFTDAKPLVNKVKTFEKGDYFVQSAVSAFSVDLQSTNYFARAIARANAKKAEGFYVPIEVILEPKPRDKYNLGIGVSTDTGPRFTAEWQRPWVNLDGHSFKADLFVSRPRQSIELGYRIPKDNPLKDFIDIQAGYRLVDENQTESDTISLGVLRQYGAKNDTEWDFIPFIRFSQEGFRQGIDAPKITTKLLTPGVTYSRVRKRGDIFVSWGDRRQITLSAGSKSLLSDIDFAKVHIQTKWIREYGKHRVILRAEAGAIETDDFDRLPSSERFFAGGDQSIRGFGLNEVADFNIQLNSDGDEERELVGGRYLSVGSAEYVYGLSDKWQAAVFVDAGSASDKFAQDLAYGYGVGAHWLSPIGRVRLYIARGDSTFEKTWRFHLNIGPGL